MTTMLPILNIIHLKKRPDRLQSFMEQMNIQNIAYNVWDGVEIKKNPVVAINLAHKQIVQDAKQKKKPYVIIAEDDLIFSCPGAWKYYLSQMPKCFDLYCGLLYSGRLNEKNRITCGMSGTNTLYTIHENFYDTFLATDNKLNLDRALGKLANIYNYYVCDPFVVTQSGGYSDHFKREMYYEPFLLGKKLFGQ